MIFEAYSQYYDLLYKDKDYVGESSYIHSLIEEYNSGTKKILEFGSGTGIHGNILGSLGYRVYGIEKSQSMIDLGESPNSFSRKSKNFSCFLGDCQSTYLGNDFDTAISLFHVLSYQTKDEEVMAFLKNVQKQLRTRGIFIFDYWYAPAVWEIGPTLRIKKVANTDLSITRIAEPECFEEKNIVNVHYQNFIENLSTKSISKIEEIHKMRAFNNEEIIQFSTRAGFSLLHTEEWMTSLTPGNNTWGVCSILQKN